MNKLAGRCCKERGECSATRTDRLCPLNSLHNGRFVSDMGLKAPFSARHVCQPPDQTECASSAKRAKNQEAKYWHARLDVGAGGESPGAEIDGATNTDCNG